MTTEIQKWLELRYAAKACEKLGKFWKIAPAPDESDWPDILVIENGHKFGLEIREIFPDESAKGSVKRKREADNNRIIRDIAEEYYENSAVPIIVKLIGSITDHTSIVRTLLVACKTIPYLEQVRLRPSPDCTSYIRKLPSSFESYNRWIYVSDRVGWVGKLDAGCIQEKINEKSTKLEKYTRNINDVRLLLVCNREQNSGKFVYSSEGSIELSGFKEVYFLSYPESAYILSS